MPDKELAEGFSFNAASIESSENPKYLARGLNSIADYFEARSQREFHELEKPADAWREAAFILRNTHLME